MKSIIAATLFALLVAVQAVQNREELQKLFNDTANKCIADLKVDESVAKYLKNMDLPADEESRCFLECVYTKTGVLKDSKLVIETVEKLGKVRYEKPEDFEHLTKLAKQCHELKKEDTKCGDALAVRKCFEEYAKKTNFRPSL